MRALIAYLSSFLTLGISGVIVQMRAPVAADFGAGGLMSPIYVDGTNGNPYFYYNGAVHPLGDQTFAPTVSPTFTGTVTVIGASVHSRTFTGTGATVMNDNIQTVNATNADVGSIRGFVTLAPTAVNCFPRGVESQTSVQLGATFSQAYGIEIGIHSQVAGSGSTVNPTSIGAFIASSHTGWLPTGVRNDCGLFIGGEDGWIVPILVNDTDAATTLFRVNQFGAVLAHSAITTNGLGGDLCGILNVTNAQGTQTWSGMRYDGTKNALVLESFTQGGTGYRNVTLAPNGGNVILGNTGTDDATTAQLQMTGFPRIANTSAAPAGGNTTVRIAFGTAGQGGLYLGSGVPTVTAPKGSIYMRTDGSSTSTRAYVNTDGGTTWTNLVTAA